jgi:multidrug resistance efflux pump
MFSLISTLGGLLVSGLPSLLGFFQDKSDKKHELELAQMQTDRELQMMERGFLAQAKVEEIRTDQVMMETDAEMTKAAYAHDAKVLEKAAPWASTFVATVRPIVTYLFVAELFIINIGIGVYLFNHGTLITNVDDFLKATDMIFSEDDMAMLCAIIGYWFGSRGWSKK